MLSESSIDGIMDGVRRCHRELIVHGAGVILNDLVTANKQPSVHQPSDVVTLDWRAAMPWFCIPPYAFQPLLRPSPVWKASDFAYLHVDNKKVFTKMMNDAAEGTHPSAAADLVLWHRTPRVLELQADTNFTRAGVINALARDLGLNSAKIKLL